MDFNTPLALSLDRTNDTKKITWYLQWIKSKVDEALSTLPKDDNIEDIKSKIWWLLDDVYIEMESLSAENSHLRENNELDSPNYFRDAFIMQDQLTEEIRKWNIITSEGLIAKIKLFFENHFPWVTIWIYRHIQSQWGFTDYETKIDGTHRQKVLREENLDEKWKVLNESAISKKFHYTLSDNWIISWAIPLTQNDELYSLFLYFERTFEDWIDINEIERRFYIYVRIIGFIIEQELKNIRSLYRDVLTWCQTKDYFNKHKEFRNYSVIAIDLDGFKQVNDTYWHSGWDEVLKKFGTILQSCVRKWEGEVIRLSWDEFCILVKNAEDNKQPHMEKIIERLDHMRNEGKITQKLTNINNWEIEEVPIHFTHWVCINTNENKMQEVYEAADKDLMIKKGKDWIAYRIKEMLDSLPVTIQQDIIFSVIKWLQEQNLHDCKTCKVKTIKKAE